MIQIRTISQFARRCAVASLAIPLRLAPPPSYNAIVCKNGLNIFSRHPLLFHEGERVPAGRLPYNGSREAREQREK